MDKEEKLENKGTDPEKLTSLIFHFQPCFALL
jgi:hypothetical protein